MNAVNIIFPYLIGKTWVFDDNRHGMKAEPFVGDTNKVINALLAEKQQDVTKFTLQFSRYPFPDYDASFTLIEETAHKSAWYTCRKTGMLFWLCPAMNHYFDGIPAEIYVKIMSTGQL